MQMAAKKLCMHAGNKLFLKDPVLLFSYFCSLVDLKIFQ